jgi:prophage antirepressor-like protein
MTQLATISYANHKFEYILKDGEPWFRAKSVATVLEYKNTEQTIRTHVHQDDRRKYSELQDGSVVSFTPTYIDHNLMNSIFINESGLYSLIMRSKKQDARQFQQWVTKRCFHPSGRMEAIH